MQQNLLLYACFYHYSTCACVEYYGKALESLIKQVKIMSIHGKMKHKRNKIFTEFRKLPG